MGLLRLERLIHRYWTRFVLELNLRVLTTEGSHSIASVTSCYGNFKNFIAMFAENFSLEIKNFSFRKIRIFFSLSHVSGFSELLIYILSQNNGSNSRNLIYTVQYNYPMSISLRNYPKKAYLFWETMFFRKQNPRITKLSIHECWNVRNFLFRE